MQGISPRSTKTRSYQFSLRTAKQPDEVLRDFAERPLPGIALAERGHNYLILKPRRRHRYSGEVAALLGVAIVLVVLILTAVSPVIIALLPLALLPGLPVILDHRPDLAISAVPDEGGGTRVTVHGLASRELAAALDAYLGGLPRHVPQPAMHVRPRTGPPVSRGAGSPP